MEHGIRLVPLPEDAYADYRYEVIFRAYKWDPQVEDRNTVARHALLVTPAAADYLERRAERLAEETAGMEEALAGAPELAARLAIPRAVHRAFFGRRMDYDRRRHVRLMRFDFHPAATGWALSEVNSDVPGGLAEASVLPKLAARFFPGCAPRRSVGDALREAFRSRVPPGGAVGFVHATAYADDRQVMQFLGDAFEEDGLRAVYAAPDHIRWENGRAVGVAPGAEGGLDGLVRFFPLEWLANLPRKADWTGFFHTATPSCNHPAAFLSQSKRLPLVWDELGVDVPAWRESLPATCEAKEVNAPKGDWIWKPALGRVGDGITVPGTVTEKERLRIEKAVRKRPGEWVAQRLFHSRPLTARDGTTYHVCVGAFTVDGRAAGLYGRASPTPRMDGHAIDLPVLVENEMKERAT